MAGFHRWAGYLSVLLRWGTKRSEKGPTGLSYTLRPLIGQQNRHFRATISNKHSTRELFLDNGESFVYLGKSHHSWTSFIVALCLLCRVPLFPWIN